MEIVTGYELSTKSHFDGREIRAIQIIRKDKLYVTHNFMLLIIFVLFVFIRFVSDMNRIFHPLP